MSAARPPEGAKAPLGGSDPHEVGERGGMSFQVWTHCRVATMSAQSGAAYGLIEDAALVVDGETLTWVGPRAELPADLLARCTEQIRAGGALTTPGLSG